MGLVQRGRTQPDVGFDKKVVIMREWLSGRASPCQGERREFESRLPLQKNLASSLRGKILFSVKCSFFKNLAYNKSKYGAIAKW